MLIATGLILVQYLSLAWCSTYIHEKRNFERRDDPPNTQQRIDRGTILPMRIALKENSYASENAESWLMDVSRPDSSRYGKHWTQDEVIRAFQPSDDTVRTVIDWLNGHGVSDITHTDNKQWLAFDIRAEDAERLLQTKYYREITQYADEDAIQTEVFCEQYSLPVSLKAHVDFVMPGIQSSAITSPTQESSKLLQHERRMVNGEQSHSSRFQLRKAPQPDGLKTCAELVTPECVRAMYEIPRLDPNEKINPNNTMGIAEFQFSYYVQPKLDEFYHLYSDVPNGTAPFFRSIDGAQLPLPSNAIPALEIEPSSNIELTQALIYPQNITVFDVGQKPNTGFTRANFFNRFVAALDGSFCTTSQRKNSSHGGEPECGIYKPTNIISISWDASELFFSPFWQRRQCNEYLKLGLQGVSVFVASGDSGVNAIPSNSTTGTSCPGKMGTAQFNPSFPASCPWVTTVGGTQIPPNQTAYDPEVAWNAYTYNRTSHSARYVDSPGGGFSIRFNSPAYQQEAVSKFFEKHNPPWKYYTNGQYQNNTGRYNRNGRGFPDVAGVAIHIPLCPIFSGKCGRIEGTSIPAPLWGAIFNLIIEERLRIGKGSLGFLNPVLYRNPEAFSDIVKGGNGYCSPADGFECVPGWDPVTGLGTPRYPLLRDIFLKLP